MGTEVFPFRFHVADYSEGPAPRHYTTESEGGTRYVRSLDATGRFVAAGTVILDGSEDHTYNDWLTFYETTVDFGATSFLFKAVRAAHSKVDGEAAGDATGAADEEFDFDKKFVDEDSLVVYSDGIKQTLTTDYTVSTPLASGHITTTASFDAGAVTFDYDWYHQVRFGPEVFATDILTRDTSLADQGAHAVHVTLYEVTPGGSDA